jgi:geranylgeranyl reductase family protein
VRAVLFSCCDTCGQLGWNSIPLRYESIEAAFAPDSLELTTPQPGGRVYQGGTTKLVYLILGSGADRRGGQVKVESKFPRLNQSAGRGHPAGDPGHSVARATTVKRLKIRPRLDADVIVAGGGPAGSAAAAHMAKSGLRVLVLDRDAFPRDKVCGDFVGPAALNELDALGVSVHRDFAATNIIRNAALHVDGRQLIRQCFPDLPGLPAYGRVIPRVSLDSWVLHAAHLAGATVIERAGVSHFEVDETGITLSAAGRTFRASLLVGADGSSSTISRLVRGTGTSNEDRIIALRAYYEGISGPEDQADLYFAAPSFPGYYWLFPAGRGMANVGVGMLVKTHPKVKDHLRSLLRQLLEHDSALRSRLHRARLVGKVIGWPLNTYNPKLPLIADRVMLIGDAAGFINPLNGEGIQYALLSGRWAAETAIECIASQDCGLSRLRAYSMRAERELAYDMALASLVVHAIRNRHLTPIWIRSLEIIVARAQVDQRYAQTMGGILAGVVPAHDVLSTRILGGTFNQALYSVAFGAMCALFRGPAYIAGQARAAGGAAIRATRDPAELIGWLGGLVRHAGDLALQSARRFMEPRPSHPNSSCVRLKIAQNHVEDDLFEETSVI